MENLISKYNVAAPRYTSYPTVPFWENEVFGAEKWRQQVRKTHFESKSAGVSLYIHLPFCEDLCTYCGCNTRITKNHKVEEPYVTSLLKEWKMYIHMMGDTPIQICEIHLGGGTPTFFQPENLQRLINGLLEGNEQTADASFSFEAHPANTTFEHLETLYNLGFRRLSLGIQDFDPEVQFVINRKQRVEDVERVMQDARHIGYTSINFDLIYGLPLQTAARIKETLTKALTMEPDRISFYSYAHVPWVRPGQRRFTEMDLPQGQEKLHLYQLGKQAIRKAGYEDVGMDHFAKPEDELFRASKAGRLHRNFMGYADRYTPLMIGLGVSSISDAWSAFAQNAKTVEEYHRLLDADILPVVKGHLLDDDDLQLRRYILDVMCRGKAVLIPEAKLSKRIKQRLAPMIADGLVSLSGEQVTVTEIGKSFLRNICMAFDERLHRSKDKEQLFSQAI